MRRTKLERAVEALARIIPVRRALLRHRLEDVRKALIAREKEQRRLAGHQTGTDRTRLVGDAQASNDMARDVGKLLAVLDALDTTTKKETTKP